MSTNKLAVSFIYDLASLQDCVASNRKKTKTLSRVGCGEKVELPWARRPRNWGDGGRPLSRSQGLDKGVVNTFSQAVRGDVKVHSWKDFATPKEKP